MLILVPHRPTKRWIAECIRRAGYAAVCVNTVDDALQMLGVLRVNLLIVWLPSSDAKIETLCQEVRRLPGYEQTPLLHIAATSCTANGFYLPGFRPGLDQAVAIPLSAEDLLSKVYTALGQEEELLEVHLRIQAESSPRSKSGRIYPAGCPRSRRLGQDGAVQSVTKRAV